MRHAAGLVLLMGALLSWGCWDFDALHKVAPPADLTPAPDLSHMDAPETCVKRNILENCTNGVDDNNDCLVDCADPECAGADECKPITTLGYGQIASTASGAAAPACVMGTSQRGALLYENLNVPATCSGCKCVQSCTSELRSYKEADCLMGKAGQQAKVELSTGMCAQISAGTNEYLDPSVAGCTADVSALKPDPVTYSKRDVLCLSGGLRADCTTVACIKALLGSTGCLMLAGDVSCPSPFLTKTLVKTEGGDGRGCTCSCAAGAGATCTGAAQLFPNSTCTGTGAALPAMTCTPLGTGTYVSYPVMPSGLTCTPTQNQTGSLPQTVITLCCLS